ncbi:MAG: hypothetical protein HUJ31_04040, partial [Pseudomonadales bacterium]|nr:hypothetical protein [Pseudomonadales bacterium]
MTDILDRIDASLEEVEEQLLRELNRFRGGNQAAVCVLDDGIRDALRDATGQLRDQLEHSGNREKLELRTERHEILEARLGVLHQLLDNDIPGDCVHQAHEEIETSRRRLEKRVAVRRKKLEAA